MGLPAGGQAAVPLNGCTALRYRRLALPAAYPPGEPEHSSAVPRAGVAQHVFVRHLPVQLGMVLKVRGCILRGQTSHPHPHCFLFTQFHLLELK